jgi:hypothetical protein
MTAKKSVSQTAKDAPRIHSSAVVIDSELERWCDVDARATTHSSAPFYPKNATKH